MSDKYLSKSLQRRYQDVDCTEIARGLAISPRWVRAILRGQDLITGPAAVKILEKAEAAYPEATAKKKAALKEKEERKKMAAMKKEAARKRKLSWRRTGI